MTKLLPDQRRERRLLTKVHRDGDASSCYDRLGRDRGHAPKPTATLASARWLDLASSARRSGRSCRRQRGLRRRMAWMRFSL